MEDKSLDDKHIEEGRRALYRNLGKAPTAFFGAGSRDIGLFVGPIAAVLAFVGVYIAAVNSIGWVIGIALGWIPAGLAAVLAYFVFRYLWFALLIMTAIGWLIVTGRH